jgi:hypothetical protein
MPSFHEVILLARTRTPPRPSNGAVNVKGKFADLEDGARHYLQKITRVSSSSSRRVLAQDPGGKVPAVPGAARRAARARELRRGRHAITPAGCGVWRCEGDVCDWESVVERGSKADVFGEGRRAWARGRERDAESGQVTSAQGGDQITHSKVTLQNMRRSYRHAIVQTIVPTKSAAAAPPTDRCATGHPLLSSSR